MVAAIALAGVTYRLGRSLYVSLTNSCNAVSLQQSRGPGFAISGDFSPLPVGCEPDAQAVADAVRQAFETSPGVFGNIVFAGAGDPLLRLHVLESSAQLIRDQYDGVQLRVNTNGLIANSGAADTAARLHSVGVSTVSVALMTADPEQYSALMKPEKLRLSPGFSLQLGHQQVCGFVSACIAAGLNVECTAVRSPEVDIGAAEALAGELGASFRARSWHP
mmetsp:Transcript_31498/g.71158  ORF Transcript_31498/g.71158 Transcript_31498/m.71158 type:complete len:220 (+) Transcript_31498:20-679(+)